jgi:hypothetical protein
MFKQYKKAFLGLTDPWETFLGLFNAEDEGDTLLQNVGKYLPCNMR